MLSAHGLHPLSWMLSAEHREDILTWPYTARLWPPGGLRFALRRREVAEADLALFEPQLAIVLLEPAII